jgi:ABC-type antimicrobial peptide transport system permease subunit
MKTLGNQLAETLGPERLTAGLSSAFGALATLIAAVGLYGVLALVVARRTREIGLRMALGARRSTILSMVLKDALSMFGIGLAVGIPCAYLLTRYVSSLLFGVEPIDTFTVAAAGTILAIATACAAVVPALRAGTIDPMQALRHE